MANIIKVSLRLQVFSNAYFIIRIRSNRTIIYRINSIQYCPFYNKLKNRKHPANKERNRHKSCKPKRTAQIPLRRKRNVGILLPKSVTRNPTSKLGKIPTLSEGLAGMSRANEFRKHFPPTCLPNVCTWSCG